MQITFRKMTPADADAVSEIEIKSFALPWKRDTFYEVVQRENTVYIVGELDKKIIAYAGAWLAFNEAEVMSVAVLQEYRGRGVGTKLFGELLKTCKERGATAVTLEVRPSNTAAIKLYESFGLKSVGRRKKYYVDNGEDALIMWNTDLGNRQEARGSSF
mgnify:CR=1 FL=1